MHFGVPGLYKNYASNADERSYLLQADTHSDTEGYGCGWLKIFEKNIYAATVSFPTVFPPSLFLLEGLILTHKYCLHLFFHS